MYNELLESLDLVSRFDIEDYEKIGRPKVKAMTEKAVLLNDIWIPKSQLRTDTHGNLYLARWLYEKTFKFA